MYLCFLFMISVLNPGHNLSLNVVWSPQDFLHRVSRSNCHWCIGTQFSVAQTDNKQLNVWGWVDFCIFLISCFIEKNWGIIMKNPLLQVLHMPYMKGWICRNTRPRIQKGCGGKKRQTLSWWLFFNIDVKGLKPWSSCYFPGTLSNNYCRGAFPCYSFWK